MPILLFAYSQISPDGYAAAAAAYNEELAILESASYPHTLISFFVRLSYAQVGTLKHPVFMDGTVYASNLIAPIASLILDIISQLIPLTKGNRNTLDQCGAAANSRRRCQWIHR